MKNSLLKIKNTKNRIMEPISTITLIFIVTLGLSIGNILLESFQSSCYYECHSSSVSDPMIGIKLFYPLNPNESRIITYSYDVYNYLTAIPVANGQSVFININSTSVTSIKAIPVNTWSKSVDFSNDTSYVSFNKTKHYITIEPTNKYMLFLVIIKKPTNDSVNYRGIVTIRGFNHDYLIVLVALTLIFIILTITKKIILKTTSFQKKTSNFLPVRLKLIWNFSQKDLRKEKYIIIVLLMWFIIQPFVPVLKLLSGSNGNSLLNINLTIIEQKLIEPLPFSLFFLAIVLCVDIAGMVTNPFDYNSIFTQSITGRQLVLSCLIRAIIIYGGLFSLIFSLKALLLSMQLGLFISLISFLTWLLLIILTLAFWVLLALFRALKSHNKYIATTEGLILITIITIIENFFIIGTTSLSEIANELWKFSYEKEIIFKSLFFHDSLFIVTPPNLVAVIPSIIVTSFGLVVTLAILLLTLPSIH